MSSGSIPTLNDEDETSGPAGDWSGTFRTFREDDRVARPRSFLLRLAGPGRRSGAAGARGGVRPSAVGGSLPLDAGLSGPSARNAGDGNVMDASSRGRQFVVDGVTALTGTHRLTRSATHLLATRRRCHSLPRLRSPVQCCRPVLLIPSRLLQSRALCPLSGLSRALSPVAARTQVVPYELGNRILRSCAFVAPPDAKCADSVRFTAHPLCIY